MNEAPTEILGLAARQFGAISRRQARLLGWTYSQERRALERGSWRLATDRVLVRTGVPPSFNLDVMVAMLDAGDDAALSFTTAAAHYRVSGFSRSPIHVSMPRADRNHVSSVVIVHRPTYLPAHHLLVVNGLRVTSPTRTLFDLANDPHMHPMRVERAVNSAWAARLTSRERLVRMEAEWCERGRRGSAFMHEYLAERPPGWVPPASNLEGRFIQIIVEDGMPAPLSQIDKGDDESWIGRIDCVDPELPNLVAEVDSERFHVAPLDAASDELRDKRLRAAGVVIVRFKEFEVWHQKDVVVARWRQARREARAAARRPTE